MNYQEAVGKRLQELLAENNISIYELYKRSNLSKSTVYRAVHAENKDINIHTIYMLCKGLDIELQEFFSSPLFLRAQNN